MKQVKLTKTSYISPLSRTLDLNLGVAMSVRIEHKTKKEDFERRGGGRKGMRKVKEKITDCSMKPGNRMTGREAEHSRSG